MFEMDKILEDIGNIDMARGNIIAGIEQLKHNVKYPEIASLDPNNWNSVRTILQQLGQIQNGPNQTQIGKIINPVLNYVNQIYDNIRDLQINMRLLRQRAPIRGTRRSGEGAISSPTEEFESLDKVLRLIYANPLNEDAILYAQRLHSRLDDKLRYINVPPENNLNNWMEDQKKNRFNNQPDQPNQQGQVPIDESPVPDNNRVDQVINAVMNAPIPGVSQTAKAGFASRVLTDIMSSGLAGESAQTLRAIRDKFIEAEQGRTTGSNSFHMPNIPEVDEEFEEPTTSANLGYYDLLKIADEVDKIDPSIADIIDQYLEENADPGQDFMSLPATSQLIEG